jgi:hypothetical protein
VTFKKQKEGKVGWTRVRTLGGLVKIPKPQGLKGTTNHNVAGTANQNAAFCVN